MNRLKVKCYGNLCDLVSDYPANDHTHVKCYGNLCDLESVANDYPANDQTKVSRTQCSSHSLAKAIIVIFKTFLVLKYEDSCKLSSLEPLSLSQKPPGKKLRLKNNYRHCHPFGKSCTAHTEMNILLVRCTCVRTNDFCTE